LPELLIGCGSTRDKRLFPPGRPRVWEALTTCDMNADHSPDVVHNLERVPYPWSSDHFDEVHAYEVLEHLGQQGDFRSFFMQFQELWRILKPGGYLCGTSPAASSPWLWGDPGHTRAIQPESLVFLDRTQYEKQVGVTSMTDYRFCYSGDLRPVILMPDAEGTFLFILKAVK
jgi:hypothetical protein